jgi:transposase
MSTSAQAIAGTKTTRRYRTQAERRRIVEETLSTGASVATVARAHGVNANQVFHWRKLYHAGLLDQPSTAASNDVRLLPVVIHDEPAAHEEDKSALEQEKAASPAASSVSAIHIEFPGHAFVSVVGSADPAVIRAVLESLR